MSDTTFPVGEHTPALRHRMWAWVRRHPWWTAFGVFLVLLGLMYPVENWRGRRAWERTKAELEAKGEVLDFAAFIKPKIPDEENVAMHPNVRGRFLRNHGGLGIIQPRFAGLAGQPFMMAELKRLPREPVVPSTIAELAGASANGEITDVVFNNIPLAPALSGLAELAGINLRFDQSKPPFVSRVQHYEVPVTITVSEEKTTAIALLDRLIKEHGLAPSKDAQTGGITLSLHTVSLREVKEWFDGNDEPRARFEEALKRARVQLIGDPADPFNRPMPDFVSLRNTAQFLATSIKVRLLSGELDAALRDLTMLKRVGECVIGNEPPTLVEVMLHVAIAGLYASTVEETLAAGLWRMEDLAVIQGQLADFDLLTTFAEGLRGERAWALHALEHCRNNRKPLADFFDGWRSMGASPGPPPLTSLKDFAAWIDESLSGNSPLLHLYVSLGPNAWVDQNKVAVAQCYQQYLEGYDPRQMRVDVAVIEANGRQVREELLEATSTPYNLFARIAVPAINRAGLTTVRNQTMLHLAQVACALERYRAAHKQYPESLQDFVPAFATKLPHDLFDGQPLRYRRTDDGQYLLYSIGWNGRDDGGIIVAPHDKSHQWSEQDGDWVWQGHGPH